MMGFGRPHGGEGVFIAEDKIQVHMILSVWLAGCTGGSKRRRSRCSSRHLLASLLKLTTGIEACGSSFGCL